MLYDPKWDKEIKADPLTLGALIAWLQTMPAEGTYNWHNREGGCLIGLYGAAMNLGARWHEFHHQLFERDELQIASNRPHTFGAALERARAISSPNHAKE